MTARGKVSPAQWAMVLELERRARGVLLKVGVRPCDLDHAWSDAGMDAVISALQVFDPARKVPVDALVTIFVRRAGVRWREQQRAARRVEETRAAMTPERAPAEASALEARDELLYLLEGVSRPEYGLLLARHALDMEYSALGSALGMSASGARAWVKRLMAKARSRAGGSDAPPKR